ncbi:helix-turn-helix domain-containing protein [Thioclava nitratireducens]
MKSGMTQDEIAKLCRVDQSTVSRWKRNERRAKLHQVTPLLQRFGERMERPPFQLYRRTNTRDSGTSVSQFLKVDGRLLLREAYDNTQDRKPGCAIDRVTCPPWGPRS